MNKKFKRIAAVTRLANVPGTLLVAVLLLLAGSLLTQQVGADDIDKKDSRRAFYLTLLAYDGSQASNACAAGFHMASLWEIHDPSNLRYDTTLGFTLADSGSGPPSGTLHAVGWVRTGFDANSLGTLIGQTNCDAWTSHSSNGRGSVVSLETFWTNPAFSVSPWSPGLAACNFMDKVWCVQD